MSTPRKPCGTNAAAKRHRAAGEPLCELCQEAERTYRRGYYRAPCGTYSAQRRHRKLGESCDVCGPIAEKGRPRLDRPHGTEAARKRHQRAGETPCSVCLEARKADRREKAARAGSWAAA